MDFTEELLRSNQSQYGLGATLFTIDPIQLKRVMEEIEPGNGWEYDPRVDNLAGPFGGMQPSAIRHKLGQERFEEIFDIKHVHWEINDGMKPIWLPWGE